jgi:hypothetical protein
MEGWLLSSAGLKSAVKEKISYLCRESNPDSLLVHSVATPAELFLQNFYGDFLLLMPTLTAVQI